MVFNPQRIRDPIHNIIGFEGNQFENMLWELINTRPFQRLRRVKQLGFSDLVYPGATHSRFAHSVGVFHIARRMMKIIETHLRSKNEFQEAQAQHALAAALLHDVGHGAFSHAFETVGKRLNIEMAKHETVSKKLILDSEIADCLKKMGAGFHKDVADVIDDDVSATLYSAVISSQFDADRLDYIQRDRMMCGTGHGAIDFEWLVENIQVGEVQFGVDEERVGKQQTFVIGPKAIAAAETFVFGLFQLYPTVYFHKTTRGAEKLFTELLVRVIELSGNGRSARTGLPENHPLVQFANDSDSIDNVLCLDDSVVWSALHLLADSEDELIASFSDRLRRRKLYKVIDVREEFRKQEKDEDALDKSCAQMKIKIEEWARKDSSPFPRILVDDCKRSPYKEYKEEKGPLNQINVLDNGDLRDLRDVSDVVKAIKDFKAFRVYVDDDDQEAKKFTNDAIREI